MTVTETFVRVCAEYRIQRRLIVIISLMYYFFKGNSSFFLSSCYTNTHNQPIYILSAEKNCRSRIREIDSWLTGYILMEKSERNNCFAEKKEEQIRAHT